MAWGPCQRDLAWAHVRLLSAKFGIPVLRAARWKAEANHEDETVTIPRAMWRPADYLIALHEFGHLLAQPQSSSILDEAAAWEWATGNTHPDLRRHIPTRDWDFAATGFAGHLQYA